jgi:hypothetical protein
MATKSSITLIATPEKCYSLWVHVYMDESLVDPNRGQECSNGLHVARRLPQWL